MDGKDCEADYCYDDSVSGGRAQRYINDSPLDAALDSCGICALESVHLTINTQEMLMKTLVDEVLLKELKL